MPLHSFLDLPPVLTLDALGCARGGRPLFSGVSLQVRPGQLLRVQGPNGAGKTSLLRMLSGLLLPSEGQVLWRDQPVSALRETYGQERVYLGHSAGLKDELSPLENLEAACALGGHAFERGLAMAALAAAGLADFLDLPAGRLSQGQRRRAGLARLALAEPSPLWVLDEPFNALDTAAAAWLESLLRNHLARSGLLVLTSHQGRPLADVPQQVLSL
jgi:heme exporter protein A